MYKKLYKLSKNET